VLLVDADHSAPLAEFGARLDDWMTFGMSQLAAATPGSNVMDYRVRTSTSGCGVLPAGMRYAGASDRSFGPRGPLSPDGLGRNGPTSRSWTPRPCCSRATPQC